MILLPLEPSTEVDCGKYVGDEFPCLGYDLKTRATFEFVAT